MITAVVPRQGYTPNECVDPQESAVEHPHHYNVGKIEAIDFIDDQGLNFSLGNVIKYVVRADHKGNPIEDLEKALWYLKHEIDRRKADGEEC